MYYSFGMFLKLIINLYKRKFMTVVYYFQMISIQGFSFTRSIFFFQKRDKKKYLTIKHDILKHYISLRIHFKNFL